ncbi:acetyl-CoA C-acyltransferase family protein [Bordetella bronchialis]|uniref:Acetyl-CoA acetyltransferase n=1 Tax=Bordetella bronchialis TaxID=463025 RepID=A0A193FTW5_9BORD|nr:acetyl-CoA C-acyltransferase family protein [Bordetella bronchialis]ANN65599.1 acetyl-CoA acetyltransferase [Bordetella bronchialis]ANN70626.1 acetyl-CoA acetyltransferase [Bordetella bronchialis]
MQKDVYVVSAVRTAIGGFGGTLKNTPPAELATTVVREAVSRAGVAPEIVGHVSMGTVITTEPRDIYLSRIAALDAGLPRAVSAYNINRLCGSGLQAIVSSAQAIAAGDCEVAVGAGAECMSRAGYLSPSNRWGARMGDTVMLDMMLNALHDPFHGIHMGMTAENVAERFGITRRMMDELAVASHQRAAAAIREGRFKEQIVPVKISSRRGDTWFDTDEHVKPDTTLEVLSGMKPAFKRDGGTVTAGNSSGINDGAAALVLASADAVKAQKLTPIGRLAGYAYAGVEPALMGTGPIPATRAVLARTGLKVADMDVIESNEAFAAQACAVMRELDFDPEKVNPNGSGISLGHPIGATGAIIATKALYELQRIGGRYALVTMCIGGGQGIAAIFERA